MSKRHMLASFRLVFAVVVLAVIITQFLHSQRVAANFSPVNFFSFFTVESNIFGAIIFIAAATSGWRGIRSNRLQYLRGAATLYMVITGIIYSLLLTGVDVQASMPWCNAVLHYIFPVIILLDWIIDRPERRLAWKKALPWLIFPLLYAVYSLIRGPLANHWYPYPFINVSLHGYAMVLVNCLAVAVAFVIISWILLIIAHFKTSSN